MNGLEVYGYNLNLIDGVLSGYLSDGNWLNVAVTAGVGLDGRHQPSRRSKERTRLPRCCC